MPPIDDKVVAMSFESSKFESGVHNTLSALDKLKASLNFHGAGKGLEEFNAAGKRVDLGHIGRSVDDINGKLVALSVAAVAIFANIASKAVNAGANLVKAFTLDPIKAGLQEYSTNLNAVQTILANTQASGATLDDVNAALLDLNKYSDQTIYNFSQMAKNIGTFTAAGVDLKASTQAIKGIANLAALSGSNADQAATAMYQLSQAISSGRVGLQDWNSVVNAGMGGTVFQRALAQTAVQMGTLKENALKLVGPMKNVSINGESFRQSMQAGPGKASWLSSGVLTETLKQFTGDLSDAQLKAQGFNDTQIKAIQQTAITAKKAATEVKTLKQVIDVAKETAGSGWAQTWQLIFGNFGEAKTLFTGVSGAVNGFINASADARNKVLGDWKALGGRTVLIKSIGTMFHNLGMVLAPIKEAFRDIFPAKTGKDLYNLTLGFKSFVDTLKPSPETIDNLRRTFKGLFALLDIGKQIIGGIFTVFGQLFGVVGEGRGGFLGITASIGDFLVRVDEALKKGNRLHNFFVGLGSVLVAPLEFLRAVGHAVSDLFSGFSPGGFFSQVDGISKKMSPLQKVMAGVSKVWDKFLESVSNSGQVIRPAFDAIIALITGFGPAVGQAASGMNFDAILQAIRTGLLAGIFLLFKDAFGKSGILGPQGIIKNISGTFGALRGSMVAMQNNIKAKTLKEIAIAIALLTVSVVALSFVNPEKLKASITAMGFMFAELLGAMAILDKIGTGAGFIKLPFIAASLIMLAGAIDILSIAVIALSLLSWEQLLKGLGSVGFLLAAISLAAIPLSANSAGMIRSSISITAIAIALNLLAAAVAIFGSMNWSTLGKGLIGVAVGLAVLVSGISSIPPGMALKGAGLIEVAFALKILAGVVEKFGGMDWGMIRKGMAGIGGGLFAIAIGLQLMPKNMVFIALGLLGVTAALKGIAGIVAEFGGMTMKEMAKGMIGLAGSLIILAVALHAMSGTAMGATALTIAAAGLALMAPALATLGKMSWGSILKSLVVLAGAITILGIAAALVGPVIPALLGLGVALVLMGGGLALAGAGIALIGIGLSALVVAAPTGVGILIAALEELVAAIPRIAKDTIIGFLAIVKALAATAPQFVDAVIKILDSLLDAIIKSSPKIEAAFNALLALALRVINDNQPKIIQAGFDLIIGLLQGVRNNIGQIVTAVVEIITRFLGSVTNNLGKIITAGAQMIISLLKGIANNYAKVITTGLDIITKFLSAIASGLGRVAIAGLSILTRLLQAISSHISAVIKLGTDIIVAFIRGVGNSEARVVAAAVNAITKFINAISKGAVKLVDAGATAIINFLNGVATVIEKRAPEMRAAGIRIGVAIVDGLTFGLISWAPNAYNKAKEIGSNVLHFLGKAAHVNSPSTEAIKIGGFIVQGLANGMSSNTSAVASAKDLGNSVITMFKDVFQIQSPSRVMSDIGQLVGQGFAQGLRGSKDDINKAFIDLNNKLTDAMVTARTTIANEQDKLDKLRAAKKPDAAAIKKAQEVIAENESVLARSVAGHHALVSTLRDEKAELIGLTRDYDKITEKLKAAKDVLIDSMKTRDEAIKTYQSQFSASPDIADKSTAEIASAREAIAAEQTKLNKILGDSNSTAEEIASATAARDAAQAQFNSLLNGKTLDESGNSVDQLATYMDALKNQTAAVGAYASTLAQLRKLGLDDETYKKLLAEGTADQAFASQLLAGGKTAVQSLNTLDANLAKVSKTLATRSAKNLYQAGVDAAQGLVDGLKSKQSELRHTMESIAKEILIALKKELKIKSPSQEFAKIGRFSMEGMAQGFTNSSKIVTNAIDDAAKDALFAMQKSMRNISDVVTDELNPNPVITPILDLTQVQSKTQELAALTNMVPITAAASFGQASRISSEHTTAQEEELAAISGGTSIKFEQNNHSPKALSEVEIYRQTRNQLSQLKSILTT